MIGRIREALTEIRHRRARAALQDAAENSDDFSEMMRNLDADSRVEVADEEESSDTNK